MAVGAVNDVNDNGITDPGDTVDFTVSVNNIGGLDIKIDSLETNLLGTYERSDDGRAAEATTLTCPADCITPGTTVDCTYTITDADQTAGRVDLTGTVRAHIDDDVNDYTSSAKVSVPVDPTDTVLLTPTATPVAAVPDIGA